MKKDKAKIPLVPPRPRLQNKTCESKGEALPAKPRAKPIKLLSFRKGGAGGGFSLPFAAPLEGEGLSLAAIQHDFMAYLQRGDEHLKQLVVDTEKVNTDTRLGIYANAYFARLEETLQENFPALHTLLGDEAFADLAQQYINKHPSRHFSLRYFGDRLAALLEGDEAYSHLPVLAEMARFEWVVWAAFDASDAPVSSIKDLQAVPVEDWGGLTFELHPSCQLISLEWNIPTLWQAITDEADPVVPEKGEYPLTWLVWRQDLGTYFRALAIGEAWALLQIQQGIDFSAMCEGVCEWVDEEHAPMRVVGFLQEWLADGVITQISPS